MDWLGNTTLLYSSQYIYIYIYILYIFKDVYKNLFITNKYNEVCINTKDTPLILMEYFEFFFGIWKQK